MPSAGSIGTAQLRGAGVCAPFVAPRLAAPRAPVVWTSGSCVPAIEARTNRPNSSDAADFNLAKLPTESILVIDPDDVQHVVVKSRVGLVSLQIRGTLAAAGRTCITFFGIGIDALPAHRDAVALLADVLNSGSPATPRSHEWSVERLELRNAIIAIDGECVGASRRDIAAVTFGKKRVDEEWPDPDAPMRHKIKRDLARGRRLLAGGYRQLVKKGTARAFGARA